MFLMILTGGFDGFEGCILNHFIHTEGFVF